MNNHIPLLDGNHGATALGAVPQPLTRENLWDRVEVSRLVAFANMVRTAIEQICMEVMQLVERSIGARGLLPPLPMERIIRDLTLYLRQPGFDAALANVGHQAFQDKERGTAA